MAPVSNLLGAETSFPSALGWHLALWTGCVGASLCALPGAWGQTEEAREPKMSCLAAQDIAPVSEGIVFQPDMPMSPFQRDIGSHQARQRLSLDATSLVRQGGSLESMTFERKQQVNRR